MKKSFYFIIALLILSSFSFSVPMKRIAFIGKIICSKCNFNTASNCATSGHTYAIENQSDGKVYTFVKDSAFEQLYNACNGLGAKVIIDGKLFPFSSIIKVTTFKVVKPGWGTSNPIANNPTISNGLEKELSEFITDIDKMNEQYELDLNATNKQSETVDTLIQKLDSNISENNSRRSNYSQNYGFSQKAQRVYFNKDFYKSVGTSPNSSTTDNKFDSNTKKYYRDLFNRYYDRYKIDKKDRYQFSE